MSYRKYGIEREPVERIKLKLKDPDTKERVKVILHGVTKAELQNEANVRRLLGQLTSTMGESLSTTEADRIVDFVLDQKIDPNNTFHLIKLWGMFR